MNIRGISLTMAFCDLVNVGFKQVSLMVILGHESKW